MGELSPVIQGDVSIYNRMFKLIDYSIFILNNITVIFCPVGRPYYLKTFNRKSPTFFRFKASNPGRGGGVESCYTRRCVNIQ